MENISTVVIVIHLMVVLALVLVVLLQRSEGGALGIGGGGGGGGGMMSGRSAANALTRTTGILAATFFATSLALGVLAKLDGSPTDILDNIPANQQQAPAANGGGDIPLGNGTGGILDKLPKQKQSAPSTGVPDSQ